MKLLVINNMVSGLDDGAIFDYIRSFSKDGDEVVLRTTDGTTDLRAYLYDAEDFDAVIASGGDGTISAIAYELADTAIPLLPFPAGTANLLTANLYSPNEPHALVDMTRSLQTMDFDIGEMTLSDGTKHGFLIMAGAGYDATIMEDAEEGKKLLGQMAYFTSAFTNTNPQFSDFEIMIDGEKVLSSGVGVLIINFSKIQFDISVIHENNPRDGLFDVVILKTKDAYGLLPAFFAALLDRSGDFPNRSNAFEVFRAKDVSVIATPALKVQYDGEAIDHFTPFKIRMLPKACRLVVSDACIKAYGTRTEQDSNTEH